MATQYPSEKGQPIPDVAAQESILQQAQAAAAAQTSSTRPTRHEALLETADLTASDTLEGELPPPAYGEIYGEIRNEKGSLGTSASVADDGRVNIRINQLNRRLSQVFTPALRQQIQSVEDSSPPPPAYIPPSLGGEEGVPPPPPLNVVIHVVGSRGDVQPFVALGKVLKDTYGHRVRLATHPTFKDFVTENGLEFFSIGGDPAQLMAFMVKNPGLMPGFRSLASGDVGQRRKDVSEYIQGCWRSCYQTGDGTGVRVADDETAPRPFIADCIIANPPSFAHIHCAEKLGIPLHIMFTMPYSPTQAFPHPLANIQSSNADPQLTNYMSYAMIEVLSWQGLGDIINRFRAKCLGLDPVSLIWAPGMLSRLKVPHTYCWSPALIPKPKDWGSQISISGFYFLNLASDYTPALELQAFLDAGSPPVYIGFGSIVLDDPNAMTDLIFEAVRKTGQRVLLSKGWGGMGADELRIPDDVFMLGNVPHDWLFKHVSCVVHHGGAGTTAAGITAGRPTLVVPFFGDQAFWGAMVARAGAGPDPIPHRQLTVDKLADAINFCLKPESLARAEELASKIASERGSDVGAQSFHQHLDVDRLRCALAPSLSAAWRVKRTKVRLSPFAACTLANANLLNFSDLKLFRPREYATDEGPWDPVSGGFTSLFGAFSSMVMGVADLPLETIKAVRVTSESVMKQSRASTLRSATGSESSSQGGRATPPNLSEPSDSSLTMQAPHTRVQSPTNLAGQSSPSLNSRSSSMSEVPRDQSTSKQDASSRNWLRGRDKSGASKRNEVLDQSDSLTGKGPGRIAKAALEAPMEISVSFTKGFHNVPKLWGDDTVRPQEQVKGFKSSMQAMGKEFGYGMYDGVTGLVTQPWKGAQKEGATGFLKGIGKGIGGFVSKPGAALFGIPSYLMKGVHKEVQNLFGNNVQNYIITSRTAQGYDDWLKSSDAEKEDVIARWKLIQKYLKKKRSPEEVVQDVLETQRKTALEESTARRTRGNTTSSVQSANTTRAPTPGFETTILAIDDSQIPLRPANRIPGGALGTAEINEAIRLSVQSTSRGDAEEDTNVERAIQEKVAELQRQRQQEADQDNLHQAMASSEVEAQRHVGEAEEFEKQLKQVMAQSLREQRHTGSSSDWESSMILDYEEMERVSTTDTGKAGGKAIAMPPPSYDQGHIAGTTQSVFEEQQQTQQGEKTAQEKTEEQIVMEYVKKQSLLETHHQNKGKGRATVTDHDDDEELQKALKLSMQDHEYAGGAMQ
jgi:UDP:flavonoid glycosyltransferase YjiC (YdhE family)